MSKANKAMTVVLTLGIVVIMVAAYYKLGEALEKKRDMMQAQREKTQVEVTKSEGVTSYYYPKVQQLRTVYDDGLECVETTRGGLSCDWHHGK